MTVAAAPALFGCPHCGALLHDEAEAERSAPAAMLSCAVCRSELERRRGRSLDAALACASATFLLLFPANLFAFLTTALLGVSRQSRLSSSVSAIWGEGWPWMAAAIAAFAIVAPFLRFGLLTYVLGSLRLGLRAPNLGRAFRWANALQMWAMLDVFLLGLVISYARLAATIPVTIGAGGLCFGLAAILGLFTRATLDKPAVWRAIAAEAAPGDADDLISCTGCERLAPAADEGAPCPRCTAVLHARKPQAVGRAAALTLAGLILYIPANLYAIATLPIGLASVEYNVLQGVVDLAQAGLLGLALLVFSASFAIPLFKLVGIGVCLISVVRGSRRGLIGKTRLYRIVEEIGRWSMVDPFVIACFVPVMNYNSLVYGRAGPAAPAFTGVVVVTMIAARAFDSRLMWDAPRRPPV